MGNERTEEAAVYIEACRKVKQIADAIKNIRIKYYQRFMQMTEGDRQLYDKLNAEIEEVATEHGLEKYRVQLISEIDERYTEDSDILSEQKQGSSSKEKLLKAYYGAIDAEQQALIKGDLRKARECQVQALKYMEHFKGLEGEEQKQLVELATHYKRGKFEELSKQREEDTISKWEEMMRQYYREEDVEQRQEVMQEIRQERGRQEKEQRSEQTEEMILE